MGERDGRLLGVPGAVVVGDDGSAEAATAVRWAAEAASSRGVELVVLRAWSIRSAPRPEGWEPGYVPSEDEYAEAVKRELEQDLVKVLGEPLGPQVRLLPVHGSADHALVDATREALLVVVGSHGRGLASALLGSTTDHLVRHAHGPVVVIPVRGR